jgi:hypothetical protein
MTFRLSTRRQRKQFGISKTRILKTGRSVGGIIRTPGKPTTPR